MIGVFEFSFDFIDIGKPGAPFSMTLDPGCGCCGASIYKCVEGYTCPNEYKNLDTITKAQAIEYCQAFKLEMQNQIEIADKIIAELKE